VDDEYHAFFVCGAFDHIRAQDPFLQVSSDPCFWQFHPWLEQNQLPLFGKMYYFCYLCIIFEYLLVVCIFLCFFSVSIEMGLWVGGVQYLLVPERWM
jgi:hypothetical protein